MKQKGSWSCSGSLKTGRRQPRQKKDNKLRSRRKRVSPLHVQYDFRTKLPEESWQSNIVSVVATLVLEAGEIAFYPWMLSNFNFLFSLKHGWRWPRDRKGIVLKNLKVMTMLVMRRIVLLENGYRKACLEVSRSIPHIIILYFMNIVVILFKFALESESTKAGYNR